MEQEKERKAETAAESEGATQELLEEVRESGSLPVKVSPEEAVKGVLCVVSMQAGAAEARDLAESLGPRLASLVRPCVLHRGERAEAFGLPLFRQRVAAHFSITTDKAEELSRSVFTALKKHMPGRELEELQSRLPADVAALWHPRRAG